MGASVILASHILFWLGGAAAARVDSQGKPSPLPPPVARMILTADAVVCGAAVFGWAAPSHLARCAGTAAYAAAVSFVSLEKLSGRMSAQRSRSMSSDTKITSMKATVPKSEASVEWTDFSWRQHWYPLAFSKVTDKSVPHRCELFGEPIVLWWDFTQSAWRAVVDACPHRLAPLSEGRIDEAGMIECPYHGWAFEGKSGACAKIPQAENMGSVAERAACGATVMHVVEKQGLVFVWGVPADRLDALDDSLIPLCESLDDDAFEHIDVSRDMPYSADMLLENTLDSSHVPFTHHKTISKRENGKPLPLVLTTKVSPQGFEATFEKDIAVGKQGTDALKAGRATQRTTKFLAPTYMHHRIQTVGKDGSFDTGFETWTVAYATPTGPGRCRLFARFPFRFPAPKRGINLPRLIIKFLPDWLNHMGQMRVLDDDNIFLPLQERYTKDVGGWRKYRMPTAADTCVRAYRQWFDRAGAPPHAAASVDEHRARAPSKQELLDRWTQHTSHCKSCTGAVRNAKRLQKVCHALILTALAMAPTLFLQRASKSIVAVIIFALLIGKCSHFAHRVESQLTTGMPEYPPPRNRPDKQGQGRELRTVEQGRSM